MNKQEAVKIAAEYFKNHTVDTFFITTDAQAFFTKQSAENHIQSLKKEDREVFEVNRAECSDDDAKATAAKEKKVTSLKTKIAEQEENEKECQEKLKAETDDKKIGKLNIALTSIQTKLNTLREELAGLESE